MYINDVTKKDEIKAIVIQDLRKYGIKFRPKKTRVAQENRLSRRVFKTALHLLPMQTVTLTNGTQLKVPKIIHELCTFLLTKVTTKGLFRKAGTRGRENDIQMSLDAGCALGFDHYEIDVASVLKRFLRELPEPLFPYNYHELFLHCMVLKENCLSAVLLACLLLPAENLNTLLYLMEFLKIVGEHSEANKMDPFNLAVVIAPTILPIEEKYASYASVRLEHNRDLVRLLIENSSHIGLLPEDIIERVAQTNDANLLNSGENEDTKKGKKRRSGSFSRLFDGLKKMVGGKTAEEAHEVNHVNTPDILMTPQITRSAKKRKGSETRGFSSKKKCELLHNLPEGSALVSTPFTPSRTPISVHPNPKKTRSPPATNKKVPALTVHNAPLNVDGVAAVAAKEKRSQWALVGRRNKTKQSTESLQRSRSTKNLLERRWSVVSQAAGWGRKKNRHSLGDPPGKPLPEIKVDVPAADASPPPPDKDVSEEMFIRSSEYEEIKNRISAIEKRLSAELDLVFVENKDVLTRSPVDSAPKVAVDGLENVQNAYVKTLEEAEALSSPTTEQLAKRLSRELKIRRSNEFKVIRSPSARKIGSWRRKSRERERESDRNASRITRRNSSTGIAADLTTPRTNLKRGRPNNVLSGLSKPSPMVAHENGAAAAALTQRPVTRSSSFHGSYLGASGPSSVDVNDCSSRSANNDSTHWTSAEGFFQAQGVSNLTQSFDGSRASLARLRTQNAGMVLAKAKLFDRFGDEDGIAKGATAATRLPQQQQQQMQQMQSLHNGQQQQQQQQRKIGAQRNTEHRVQRMLRTEDRRSSKKNSPRRRQRRLNASRSLESPTSDFADFTNKENKFAAGANSPKQCKTPLTMMMTMPAIRKPLSVKSPKRILRTPMAAAAEYKGTTPLRALSNRNQNYSSPHF